MWITIFQITQHLCQNMERVGERLEQAQDSYTQAFSQLSKGKGNVISQVEFVCLFVGTKLLGIDFQVCCHIQCPQPAHAQSFQHPRRGPRRCLSSFVDSSTWFGDSFDLKIQKFEALHKN